MEFNGIAGKGKLLDKKDYNGMIVRAITTKGRRIHYGKENRNIDFGNHTDIIR